MSAQNWQEIRKRYVSLMAMLEARFKSGNSVPVERAHITAAEWQTLQEYDEADESLSNEMAMQLRNRAAYLRDEFAGKALPAHCTGLADADLRRAAWHAEAARLAYETADAMLAAREQTP